jgi:hypothetical protein
MGSPSDQQGFIEVATPTNDSEFIRVLTVSLIKALAALFMLMYFLGVHVFFDYSRKSKDLKKKKKGDQDIFKNPAEVVRFSFFILSLVLIFFALVSGFG